MREGFIVSANKNNGYPTFSDAVEFEEMGYCRSSDLFLANSTDYPYMKSGRFSLILGAFADCTNLIKIVIPESVKFIGDTSFRNTKLTSVKIAPDCVYGSESFPDSCKINFY